MRSTPSLRSFPQCCPWKQFPCRSDWRWPFLVLSRTTLQVHTTWLTRTPSTQSLTPFSVSLRLKTLLLPRGKTALQLPHTKRWESPDNSPSAYTYSLAWIASLAYVLAITIVYAITNCTWRWLQVVSRSFTIDFFEILQKYKLDISP